MDRGVSAMPQRFYLAKTRREPPRLRDWVDGNGRAEPLASMTSLTNVTARPSPKLGDPASPSRHKVASGRTSFARRNDMSRSSRPTT